MAGETPNLNFDVSANADGFVKTVEQVKQKLGEAANSASSANNKMAGSFSGLQGVMGGLTNISLPALTKAFSAAAVVIAAVDFLKFANNLYGSVAAFKELSEKTGASVEGLSQLSAVAKVSGKDIGFVADAMVKLTKGLSGDEEETKGAARALKGLSIEVESFKQLDPSDQIKTIAEKLNGFADGAGKTSYALALFGRAGADLLPFLKDLAQDGVKAAKITREQAYAADEYEKALKKLEAQSGVFKRSMALNLLPTLAEAAKAMNDAAESGGLLRGVLAGLNSIFTAGGTAQLGISAQQQSYQIELMRLELKNLEESAGKGDQAAIGRVTVLKENLRMAASALQRTREQMDAIHKKNLGISNNAETKPTMDYVGSNEKKPKAEESNSSKWDAELGRQKEAHAALNAENQTFFEFSKSTELAFWRAKADIKGIGIKDAQAVQGKITAIVLEIQKQEYEAQLANFSREQAAAEKNLGLKREFAERELALITERFGRESKEVIAARAKIDTIERESRDQRRRLAEQDVSHISTMAALKVDAEQSAADRQLASGQITQLQRLEMQQQFERQRFDIEFAALQQRLEMAALDPNSDPAALQQIQDKKLEMIQQFENKKREIEGNVKLAVTAPANNVFGEMQTSFSSAITEMVAGTQTLGQAMEAVYKRILASYIENMIAKPIAERLTAAVRESAIGKWMAAQAIANQGASSAAVVAAKTTEGTAVVAINAAEGATGAAASQASIPFIGPVLAVAAAAAMMSFIKGMGGGGGGSTTSVTRIPSAAGGWDIPRGMNPMTQLHEQEMILPASIANPLRSAIAGMDGGGGQGQGGGTFEVNINAVPMGNNMFMIHRNDLVKAIKSAHRDGAL
jgi:hypothetical protein